MSLFGGRWSGQLVVLSNAVCTPLPAGAAADRSGEELLPAGSAGWRGKECLRAGERHVGDWGSSLGSGIVEEYIGGVVVPDIED